MHAAQLAGNPIYNDLHTRQLTIIAMIHFIALAMNTDQRR